MYRIINTASGAELGIVDKVVYIKIGQSGDFCPSQQEEAVGLALSGTPYNLLGHQEIGGADTVVVSEFDGGALVAEQKRAIDGLIVNILEG